MFQRNSLKVVSRWFTFIWVWAFPSPQTTQFLLEFNPTTQNTTQKYWRLANHKKRISHCLNFPRPVDPEQFLQTFCGKKNDRFTAHPYTIQVGLTSSTVHFLPFNMSQFCQIKHVVLFMSFWSHVSMRASFIIHVKALYGKHLCHGIVIFGQVSSKFTCSKGWIEGNVWGKAMEFSRRNSVNWLKTGPFQ